MNEPGDSFSGNPYPSQPVPAGPERFVGRRAYVSRIYSRIGAERPQSISLVGEPRIGKTSLLHHLIRPETRARYLHTPGDYLFVLVSIEPEDGFDFASFSRQLCRQVVREVAQQLPLTKQPPSYDFFKAIVEQLHRHGKKMVIFFDDFHLITQNESFPLEFFSFLRSLANNYPLAYVTTSFLDLQKLCVSKEIEESPFFNIFTNMTLKPWEKQEAQEYIVRLSREAGHSLEREVERLWQLAGGFPYPLQLGCHLAFEKKRRGEALREQDWQQIENALSQALADYLDAMDAYFTDEQKKVFRYVLQGKKIPPEWQYLSAELQRRGYLDQKNGRIVFAVGLLERYYRQRVSARGPVRARRENSFLRRLFSRLWPTRA